MAIYNCPQCGAILPYSGAACSSCARKRADEQRWRDQMNKPSSYPSNRSSSSSSSRSSYVPGKYGIDHRASDGAVYAGDFIKGKREGKGISEYSDGSKYVGEYLHDIQHGAGVFTYANGTEYVGFWENGKRHGKGEITYADGSKVFGIWEDGELISDLEPVIEVDEADDGEADVSFDMLEKFIKREETSAPASAALDPNRDIWNKLENMSLEERNELLASHPDVIVPSGVDKIPDNMFKDCINLRSIRFNQDLREIGIWAFKGCKNLGPDLVIPSSVERIRRFAFSNCYSIRKAVIPNHITLEEASLMCSVTVVEFETNPPIGVVLEKGAFRCCNMTMSKEMQKKIKDLNSKAFK